MKIVNEEYMKEDSIDPAVYDIGPGVTLTLSATEDGMGHNVKLEGTFRSGGMEEAAIVEKLQAVWKELDIDASEATEEVVADEADVAAVDDVIDADETVEEGDMPASMPSDPNASIVDDKPIEVPAEEVPAEEVPAEDKPAEEEKKEEDVPPAEVV